MIHINLIKKLRVNQEMTQLQIARACNVTQATVAMWEKGICFPKADKIVPLAMALNCRCDDLLQMAKERKNRVGA